jgi:hypothetical protein
MNDLQCNRKHFWLLLIVAALLLAVKMAPESWMNAWAVVPKWCAPTSFCAAWHIHPMIIVLVFGFGVLIGALGAQQ